MRERDITNTKNIVNFCCIFSYFLIFAHSDSSDSCIEIPNGFTVFKLANATTKIFEVNFFVFLPLYKNLASQKPLLIQSKFVTRISPTIFRHCIVEWHGIVYFHVFTTKLLCLIIVKHGITLDSVMS
jgi:hypothetical protein